MKTQLIYDKIEKAADIIKSGGLVAVPTETVYGLAGNGLDETAVEDIYEVKGRPAVKPLSLMVSGADALDRLCIEIPKQARLLAERFWPGPLTIVLKAKSDIPSVVLAGGTTVGLRCPDHPLTLNLLRECGLPLAAPSANPSGEESPKTAEQVITYFDGKIAAVIDGGKCGIGLESTIIDMSAEPYRILRKGALEEEKIADALVSGLKTVGISGGTGCGKTTALKELESAGALILDCDEIYHELLESSDELIADLREEFPSAVNGGKLDRKTLGTIVFKDEEALGVLNTVTHAHIRAEIMRRLREFAMNGGSIAAIDAIELFSSGLDKLCFTTVAVVADRELRIERIMLRDNISREYAAMRVDAQHPASYFEERCDHVLYNNDDREQYRRSCHQLIKEIL